MKNKEQSIWQNEWFDMPEFVQKKHRPFQMINIRFETQEDVDAFARLIGQNITEKTKSLWFPKREIVREKKIYES